MSWSLVNQMPDEISTRDRSATRPAGGRRERLLVNLRGTALLTHPFYNKGTAFSLEERAAFGLDGLLPHHVSTMEEQLARIAANIERKSDPLEKYVGLASLQDRNEHLFYRLLAERVEELLPIVYTPTVGRAAQEFSHIFRRPRGVWITPAHRGRVAAVLRGAPTRDPLLLVATDNERILGLGDQGAGGMTIPIGKLALYTLGAGIHPARTLAVSLDVGTDNRELLEDPLYLGWREPRLRGAPYDELIEEFVTAVADCFPRALLQWEDFKKSNAIRLLERYRSRLLCFNDDIQGTAAVALAGILAGVRATGLPRERHTVVILGAGAAGVGIAALVRDAQRRAGLAGDEAARRLAVLDSRGLLTAERELDAADAYKREFAWPEALAAANGLGRDSERDLEAVVRELQPTVLVGTSGQPGAFTEAVVRAMGETAERPLVFPFSNPTSKAEATPAQILEWTSGRALVATGSPFEPVDYGGRTHRIGQGNNVFIFPGVGLGALVGRAREVTDRMFTVAAETLAAEVTGEDLASGALYPRLTRLRRVSARIAEAVIREARDAAAGRPLPDEEIPAAVAAAMWSPVYPVLEPA